MIINKHSTIDTSIVEEGAVLLIDKPLTWSSFDVVNKIRLSLKHAFGIKKIKVGHAGTLDPLATGLLIVCIGKKTKTIDLYQNLEKTYSGVITFGAETPSFDAESDISATYPTQHIDDALIKDAIGSFTGDILQKPPIFSAIKIKGTSSYTLARKGKEVELSPRPITIYDFQCIDYTEPNLHFSITCSKGTYIRSIAHDFGKFLNSGGFLSALSRDAIGPYKLEDALSITEFQSALQQLKTVHP